MLNEVPYEVVGAPFTLWIAPVGTAFPTVDVDPSSTWVQVGTSGSLNYDSAAGVTVEHRQAANMWRSLGDTGSRKVFGGDEDLLVRLSIADLTLEQYALALNMNTVTFGTSGAANVRSLGMSRGYFRRARALLIRGPSPEMEDGITQYQVWRAVNVATTTIQFRRTDPALLALEWAALVDPAQTNDEERFGKILTETEAAS